MAVVSSKSSFTISSWQEDRTNQATPRVTPAHVTFTLPEVGGKITAEYLMTYLPGGNAKFIFTDTIIVENLEGKQGSFVTQGQGNFNASTHSVEATFEIVHGSGTNLLQNIKGKGSMQSAPSSLYAFEVTV